MTLPAHHRPGHLMECAFPSLGWVESIAAEFDDFFERMNRFLRPPVSRRASGPSRPLADLHETGTCLVVGAELLGIKREDIGWCPFSWCWRSIGRRVRVVG
ncbi:hypothetical protein EDD90_0126 [Streptomyces sp. Ag109_O5-1]|nr:hypothetical protein EDD90_0126 [Streptomyces sp. Ag109_O5-1]